MAKGIKVTKNGRSMIVSTFKKANFLEFVPAVGDEVQFYYFWLDMEVSGVVIKLKGQKVTALTDSNKEVEFTLRESGEWIEKGFQHYDRKRKLKRIEDES